MPVHVIQSARQQHYAKSDEADPARRDEKTPCAHKRNNHRGKRAAENIAERCAEVSTVERRPLMDGRHMIMVLAPKAAKASFAEKKAAREKAASKEAQDDQK